MNTEKSRSSLGHKTINLNIFLSYPKYEVDISLALPVKAQSISHSVCPESTYDWVCNNQRKICLYKESDTLVIRNRQCVYPSCLWSWTQRLWHPYLKYIFLKCCIFCCWCTLLFKLVYKLAYLYFTRSLCFHYLLTLIYKPIFYIPAVLGPSECIFSTQKGRNILSSVHVPYPYSYVPIWPAALQFNSQNYCVWTVVIPRNIFQGKANQWLDGWNLISSSWM